MPYAARHQKRERAIERVKHSPIVLKKCLQTQLGDAVTKTIHL